MSICLNIYKSSFSSLIGNIYYLWIKDKRQAEKIAFLSNSSKSLEDYIKRLRISIKDLSVNTSRSEIIEKSVREYLKGDSVLRLDYIFLTGNDFERKIWQATSKIPYACVASYREIAERSGYSNAWRAAGTALGKNPLMLVVPCHRVIKSSGEIGRYGGGEDIKELLLNLEANFKDRVKTSGHKSP